MHLFIKLFIIILFNSTAVFLGKPPSDEPPKKLTNMVTYNKQHTAPSTCVIEKNTRSTVEQNLKRDQEDGNEGPIVKSPTWLEISTTEQKRKVD